MENNPVKLEKENIPDMFKTFSNKIQIFHVEVMPTGTLLRDDYNRCLHYNKFEQAKDMRNTIMVGLN